MDTEIARLLAGTHPRPDRLLGRHAEEDRNVVRALLPGAVSAAVAGDGWSQPLERVAGSLFVGSCPEPDYVFAVRYGANGTIQARRDPYVQPPRLTEADRTAVRLGSPGAMLALGSHEVLGGVAFAVWAPNARGVTVFGDFDSWGAESFPMVCRDGIWELTVPTASIGDRYKYRIVGADGLVRDKADPLAHRTECPPANASIITGHSDYVWNDDSWLGSRTGRDAARDPLSIYEVHLGSWRLGLDYRTAARLLVDHVCSLNFTHIQLLPVTEHPYGPSWGYQVGSFFAPSARYGSPDDLRYLIDHCHAHGIGVLLDWVPAHFPKDDFALGEFDGTPLYEHADPLRRDQPDWGTYAFNLGREEVRGFLLASADYWCTEFHVDGLRVDAVAAMLYRDYSRAPGQWRPAADGSHRNEEAIDFLRALTDAVHRNHPGVMVIAEESTAWPGVTAPTSDGGLGFDFKWDLGWMHSTLGYLARPPADRGTDNHTLATSLTTASQERYVLPLSHDEMVHGKGTLLSRMAPHSDDRAVQADHMRALLAFQWAHPGKKLLFMGQEFGQLSEWSEHRGLDWDQLHGPDGPVHRGIATLVRDLGRLLRTEPALHAGDCEATGLELLTVNDAQNAVIAFLRRPTCPSDGRQIAIVVNFSDTDLMRYRLGLPSGGRWGEILNTAAVDYHGRGLGNLGAVWAHPQPSHGRPYSAELTVPARSSIWLAQQV